MVLLAVTVPSDYSGVCVLICAVIVPAATILGHSEWRSVDDHPKVLIMSHEFPYTCVAEGVHMGVRVGSPVFPLTAHVQSSGPSMSQSMLGHQTRGLIYKACVRLNPRQSSYL